MTNPMTHTQAGLLPTKDERLTQLTHFILKIIRDCVGKYNDVGTASEIARQLDARPSPPASAEVVELVAQIIWNNHVPLLAWTGTSESDRERYRKTACQALQAGAAVQVPEDDGMVRLPPEALYYISATEYWALDPQDAKERTHYLRRKLNFSGLPMDIAPQDKRDVLLYCGQWVCGRRSDDVKDPERLPSGYTTDCTWPGMTEPTAWLPLPKGIPAAPQKQGA